MSYRILASKLGYSCPESSWQEAMKMKIDLIGADAGSMDPGPYYLGTGKSYMKPASLKRDFTLLLRAALRMNCPLLIGSLGLAGDEPHLAFMLELIREIFEEENARGLRVAVVDGHVDNGLLIGRIDELRPLGSMPALAEDDVRNSRLVAQMGIAPYITALDAGAQIVLCGRSCDVSIFAADPVRRGIDPGLAFQAAHILECGAIACDPGSASDYLIAEFRDDGSVVFIPPNPERKATVYSVAAHALYEESHPCLQYYPEGVLVMHRTEYFRDSDRTAGIRNAAFVHSALTVKIEGSRKIGNRLVSFLPLKGEAALSRDPFLDRHLVYGLNAVERSRLLPGEQEIGILLKVSGSDGDGVEALSTVLKGFLLHFGYPGRITTAGNLAFPMSPSEVVFREADGTHTALVLAGTREPRFIEQREEIFRKILALAQEEYPAIYAGCTVDFIIAGPEHPLLFLETVEETAEEAARRHEADLKQAEAYHDPNRPSFLRLEGADSYAWSVFHLWNNENAIREHLFPIRLYEANGRDWRPVREMRPAYSPIGLTDYPGSLDDRSVDAIEPVAHSGEPVDSRPLLDMIRVLRSKDAGINTITYDVFFKSEEEYRQALRSNAFTKGAIAKTLGVPEDRIMGTFRADPCFAVKISRYRDRISGTPGSPDVFGAQQHMKIERMRVPIYR